MPNILENDDGEALDEDVAKVEALDIDIPDNLAEERPFEIQEVPIADEESREDRVETLFQSATNYIQIQNVRANISDMQTESPVSEPTPEPARRFEAKDNPWRYRWLTFALERFGIKDAEELVALVKRLEANIPVLKYKNAKCSEDQYDATKAKYEKSGYSVEEGDRNAAKIDLKAKKFQQGELEFKNILKIADWLEAPNDPISIMRSAEKLSLRADLDSIQYRLDLYTALIKAPGMEKFLHKFSQTGTYFSFFNLEQSEIDQLVAVAAEDQNSELLSDETVKNLKILNTTTHTFEVKPANLLGYLKLASEPDFIDFIIHYHIFDGYVRNPGYAELASRLQLLKDKGLIKKVIALTSSGVNLPTNLDPFLGLSVSSENGSAEEQLMVIEESFDKPNLQNFYNDPDLQKRAKDFSSLTGLKMSDNNLEYLDIFSIPENLAVLEAMRELGFWNSLSHRTLIDVNQIISDKETRDLLLDPRLPHFFSFLSDNFGFKVNDYILNKYRATSGQETKIPWAEYFSDPTIEQRLSTPECREMIEYLGKFSISSIPAYLQFVDNNISIAFLDSLVALGFEKERFIYSASETVMTLAGSDKFLEVSQNADYRQTVKEFSRRYGEEGPITDPKWLINISALQNNQKLREQVLPEDQDQPSIVQKLKSKKYGAKYYFRPEHIAYFEQLVDVDLIAVLDEISTISDLVIDHNPDHDFNNIIKYVQNRDMILAMHKAASESVFKDHSVRLSSLIGLLEYQDIFPEMLKCAEWLSKQSEHKLDYSDLADLAKMARLGIPEDQRAEIVQCCRQFNKRDTFVASDFITAEKYLKNQTEIHGIIEFLKLKGRNIDSMWDLGRVVGIYEGGLWEIIKFWSQTGCFQPLDLTVIETAKNIKEAEDWNEIKEVFLSLKSIGNPDGSFDNFHTGEIAIYRRIAAIPNWQETFMPPARQIFKNTYFANLGEFTKLFENGEFDGIWEAYQCVASRVPDSVFSVNLIDFYRHADDDGHFEQKLLRFPGSLKYITEPMDIVAYLELIEKPECLEIFQSYELITKYIFPFHFDFSNPDLYLEMGRKPRIEETLKNCPEGILDTINDGDNLSKLAALIDRPDYQEIARTYVILNKHFYIDFSFYLVDFLAQVSKTDNIEERIMELDANTINDCCDSKSQLTQLGLCGFDQSKYAEIEKINDLPYFNDSRDARDNLAKFNSTFLQGRISPDRFFNVLRSSTNPSNIRKLIMKVIGITSLSDAKGFSLDDSLAFLEKPESAQTLIAVVSHELSSLACSILFEGLPESVVKDQIDRIDSRLETDEIFSDNFRVMMDSIAIYAEKYKGEAEGNNIERRERFLAIRQALGLQLVAPEEYDKERFAHSRDQFDRLFEQFSDIDTAKLMAAWEDHSTKVTGKLDRLDVSQKEALKNKLSQVATYFTDEFVPALNRVFGQKYQELKSTENLKPIDQLRLELFDKYIMLEGKTRESMLPVYRQLKHDILEDQTLLKSGEADSATKQAIGKSLGIRNSLLALLGSLIRLSSFKGEKIEKNTDYVSMIDESADSIVANLKKLGIIPEKIEEGQGDLNELLSSAASMRDSIQPEDHPRPIEIETSFVTDFNSLARCPEMTNSCQRLTELTGHNQCAYSRLIDGIDQLIDVQQIEYETGTHKANKINRLARCFIELSALRIDGRIQPVVLLDRIYINAEFSSYAELIHKNIYRAAIKRFANNPEILMLIPDPAVLGELVEADGYEIMNISSQYFVNESNLKSREGKYYDSISGITDTTSSRYESLNKTVLRKKQ